VRNGNGGNLRPALVWTALTVGLLGLVYPAVVTAVAKVAFPRQANGSLVEKDGRVVGSELIGQAWKSERYFHGRPSAAGKDGYDAANSSGSNLGPTSKALAERVHADQAALQKLDGDAPPLDLLTTSGSGLDPHISPAAARYQIPRIARARNLPPSELEALVARYTEGRTLGLFGEPRVNVLRLNLALDGAQR
jgi:K+-transporting ATPase ATPase C chain